MDHWTLIFLAYVVLPASFVWTSVRSICYGSPRLAFGSVFVALPVFWYSIYLSGRRHNLGVERVGANGWSVEEDWTGLVVGLSFFSRESTVF